MIWPRKAHFQVLCDAGTEASIRGLEAMVKRLQDHVKALIAPYKYPRSVKFLDALPKTATGKIQRFRLREH